MKKVLLTIILIFILLMSYCAITFATEDGDFVVTTDRSYVKIILDKVTGVEYIVYNGRTICPRLNEDGTLFTADQE